MGLAECFRLEGKKLFITGGSRGLGREMALAIAEAGADVALAARDAVSLKSVAEEIRALGRQAWTFPADIGDPQACQDACEKALRDAGPFDILINNVGGRRSNVPVEQQSLAQWQELIDLNLTSAFVCCKVIGGAMIERGRGGRVINISSINGVIAGRNIAGRHYETAKAGIIQLTRSLAVDWAPHRITVNAICPGIFATEPNKAWAEKHPEIIESYVSNIPLGELGAPEDLGPLAVYLASDASRYMTGASLVIDGGYTCW
ncbi:SDR family NAD(P)-dependent oxidoreductase [Pelagibius sp. CAU 1746]|uniref:SDR family NAD(P)-dependent oxidoreductase n=1 Tax=Pelagibius sp. CAU 1746 TaxID=3140370 RepID=UPI00325BDF1A